MCNEEKRILYAKNAGVKEDYILAEIKYPVPFLLMI